MLCIVCCAQSGTTSWFDIVQVGLLMARTISRKSNTSQRNSRQQPAQRRPARWPWLIVLALLGVMSYFTLPRDKPNSRAAAPAPTTEAPLIGIVAGHWQNDSGATCDDGLREVDITLPVARAVAAALQERGYRAEVLPEFADQLPGYRADAFLSIHVDSCIPGLSGYKIVGSSQGVADESKRLADCISRSYAAATGLGFDENTITPAMTQYHAFDHIDPHTPAAIIELGFLADDASLLIDHQDRVVQGIVDGLVEFLSPQSTPTPGP